MVDFAKLNKDRAERMAKTVEPKPAMVINGELQTGTAPLKETAVAETVVEAPLDMRTSNTALAETAQAALPVEGFFAPEEMEDAAGAGQENVTSANTLLPRLAILQKLSPQINKRKVEFIQDAEIGDWCDLSTGDIFKEEVDLIPCHFITQYIKWKKNRGGFAGNLGASASALDGTTLNEKRQNVTPEGDTIAETATWYCLLRVGMDWRRVFLPFSNSGLKVSRRWMTLIRAEKLFGRNGPFTPPLYYRPWRLKVAMETNEQGDWFLPVPGRVDREIEEITTGQPDKFRTVYHEMALANDRRKWLLDEAKAFYADARDNLVVGDMSKTDDMNDPANARTVGSTSVADQSTTM